jgi:hypothetical protein
VQEATVLKQREGIAANPREAGIGVSMKPQR